MDVLLNILSGELSREARIWTALWPALVICAYFVLGLVIYAFRCALKGQYQDAELIHRPATRLTGLWVRMYFAWIMQPVWAVVVRSGIPANALTTLSVLLATGSGIALAAGRFALGGWLYIFAGICDFLDGRVARANNSATPSGAALDSVLDRYADAAVLMGLAWFYRDSWVLVVVLVAMAGSSLVPYIRAKAEASGVNMSGVGFMQRAERIVYLGVSVALSPIVEAILVPADTRPVHRLAVIGVVLLAVSTQLTAVQRLLHLLAALGGRDIRSSWFSTGRGAFARNLVAAIAATVSDFALVWVLMKLNLATAVSATVLGCILGAGVNFSLNRIWTFASTDAKLPQIGRYGFVSATSAGLNAGGVALMLLLPKVPFVVAWLIARVMVFLTWNYPLHRDYVFGSPKSQAPQPLELEISQVHG